MSVAHLVLFCLVLVQCRVDVSGDFIEFMKNLPDKLWDGIVQTWDSVKGNVQRPLPSEPPDLTYRRYFVRTRSSVDNLSKKILSKKTVPESKPTAITIPYIKQPRGSYSYSMRANRSYPYVNKFMERYNTKFIVDNVKKKMLSKKTVPESKKTAINIPYITRPRESYAYSMRANRSYPYVNKFMERYNTFVEYDDTTEPTKYIRVNVNDVPSLDDESDVVIKFEKFRLTINSTVRIPHK